jgi:hypothetical protein
MQPVSWREADERPRPVRRRCPPRWLDVTNFNCQARQAHRLQRTEGEDVRTIHPAGRDAWALASMLSAGVSGCTPIDQVGPRWSHYIWKLRTVYGLAIESVEEQHGGEFSGRHVRYVLRSRVGFADPADAARHGAAQ